MNANQEKYYCLCMFPYPSGELHMGHVRNYAIGDVIARNKKQRGYDVLYPMGWDAFGLPAENAAIQHKINPQTWVKENIKTMRAQLKTLEFGYDWTREICTSDPEYYRWGQWLFLRLWDSGLVYRKHAKVHWCTQCKTVLANEQVVGDGVCWRHTNEMVEERELAQWYIRVTDFAQELLEDLKELEGHWPVKVLQMQRNWIGKKQGCEIEFTCENSEILKVFTTHPETLFGVTFIGVGIEYPCLQHLVNSEKTLNELVEFVEHTKTQGKKKKNPTKEGLLLDAKAIHPYTNEKLPIFVTNFVISDYESGALMGVPAHDKRDWEFAQKYNLEIRKVVDTEIPIPFEANEGKMINSDMLNGLTCEQAREKIMRLLEEKNIGREKVSYRLRDWLISRQRYWGNPIPLIECTRCSWVREKEENLPILLPITSSIELGEKFLATEKKFVETDCPACKDPAKRETDTMDTFVCSSWYFLRYLNPTDSTMAFSEKEEAKWMPVDMYIGGVEHACLHLLYSRFITKFLYKSKLTTHKEPFQKLLTQGMVVNRSYYHSLEKKYLSTKDLQERGLDYTSPEIISKIEKMGKSTKNGIDPQNMIDTYGVDAVRLFVLFAAPPEKDLEWDEKGVEGCARFIKRVSTWILSVTNEISTPLSSTKSLETVDMLEKMFQQTLKKVTYNLEETQLFNVCIANLMEFINSALKITVQTREDQLRCKKIGKDFLQILHPFAPKCSVELLKGMKQTNLYWPQQQENLFQENTVVVVYQINGKVRAQQEVKRDLSTDELLHLAKSHPTVVDWLKDKYVYKEIVVPNKVVNLVVKDCQ